MANVILFLIIAVTFILVVYWVLWGEKKHKEMLQ